MHFYYESFFSNALSHLGPQQTIENPNLLEAIMTKLTSLDKKMNEIKTEILSLKRTIISNSIDSDSSDFQFDRCQTVEQLIELAKSLQNKEYYSKMVKICSRLPGNDEYDRTYKILTYLTRKDVLGLMNKTGTFNKTKFPGIISQLIFDAILLNFDCSHTGIEKSIGRVLHNCIPDAKRRTLFN